MKLSKLYDVIVKKGLKEDQRPKKDIDETLRKARKEYRALKGIDRQAFDGESLKNPYADTRILVGTGNEEVKNVMVGIDIGVGEVLLADRLREKGKWTLLSRTILQAGRLRTFTR